MKMMKKIDNLWFTIEKLRCSTAHTVSCEKRVYDINTKCILPMKK